MADGLSKLINLLRAAEKAADALRVVEKKPHDEAGAAVQAKFKPITDKCKRAIDGCKKALTPWLEKVEAAKRATEAAAKKAAEEAIRAAQEALRTSDPTNLEDREAAEVLVQDAKFAQIDARKATKDTAKASSGGVGRAVSLRTTYSPVMTDPVVAARHFWGTKPAEMKAFIQSLAEDEVREAGKAAEFISIPGFIINSESKAV